MNKSFAFFCGRAILLVCLSFLSALITLAANDNTTNQLEMESLVNEGLANNPSVLSARQETVATRLAINPTGTLPDPTVGVGIEGVPVDTFSMTQMDMTAIVISLTQPLPYPGKLKIAKNIAATDAKAAEQQARAVENKIAFDIRTAFLDWANNEESLRVARKNIAILDQLNDAAISQYSVGKAAQWDALQAQIERTKMDREIISLNQENESVRATMAQLLGRTTPRVDGTPVVKWTPPTVLNEEDLYKRAERNNPSLAYLKYIKDKMDFSADLANKGRRPDFAVTLAYGIRQDGTMNGVVQKRPDYMSAMLEIMLPLYSSRKQTPLARAAQSRALGAQYMYDDELLTIKSQIRDYVLRIRKTDEIEKLLRTTLLPQARTSLDSALSAYKVGKLDFLTALTSQQNLLKIELEYYQTRIEREKDFAALALLVGEPPKPAPLPVAPNGNNNEQGG